MPSCIFTAEYNVPGVYQYGPVPANAVRLLAWGCGGGGGGQNGGGGGAAFVSVLGYPVTTSFGTLVGDYLSIYVGPGGIPGEHGAFSSLQTFSNNIILKAAGGAANGNNGGLGGPDNECICVVTYGTKFSGAAGANAGSGTNEVDGNWWAGGGGGGSAWSSPGQAPTNKTHSSITWPRTGGQYYGGNGGLLVPLGGSQIMIPATPATGMGGGGGGDPTVPSNGKSGGPGWIKFNLYDY